MYKIFIHITCLMLTILLLGSCKKYLQTKSIQTLSTPETLEDLQLLIDYPDLNFAPTLNNVSSDEYYVNFSDWQNLPEIQQKGYVWHPELNNYEDWNTLYRTVYYANTVLFNLDFINSKGQEQAKSNIKGSALFHRAHSFYQVAQLYATQYEPGTANTDLGIVLRLNADFNEASKRSTIQETYDRILQDLLEAANLLPETSQIKTRPSRSACYGLIARTYLQIGDFTKAKEFASKCLQINNSLIDYNTLSAAATYPIPFYNQNPEILFHYKTDAPLNADDSRAKIDSNLYSSFEVNDLRKEIFFRDNSDGTFAFKGNYSGDYDLFNGLATDEIYLIRAECLAREGNVLAAMSDLNLILIKRWKTGTFVPFTASNSDQALTMILNERKKELINRGTRWSDLKRLNKDSRYSITLKRLLNNQTFTLAPDDLRYILLIPQQIMNLTKLQQNAR